MSIALMSVAWKLDVGATDKIVLLALADRADDDGKCWPGISSLSKKCGLSGRSVQRAIQSLVDNGHLSRFEQKGVGCTYRVHPRHIDTPDTVSPPTKATKTPDTVSPNTSGIHQRENVKRGGDFAEFWTIYPTRKGKIAAEGAFNKAVKRDGAQTVMAGAKRYAAHIRAHPPDDPKFIPHAATWLNRGSYEDELEEQGNGNTNQRSGGRMGGSDKPQYRVQPGWEAFKRLAAERAAGESLEGDGAGDDGIWGSLALPQRH